MPGLELLKEFQNLLPASEHPALLSWWRNLGPALQAELAAFANAGAENTRELAAINQELAEREQRMMIADELRDLSHYDFPNQDYYENLIGHEVILCLRGPTFHICQAHPRLRCYLLLGFLPKNFTCFIDKPACQMQHHLQRDEPGYWRLR